MDAPGAEEVERDALVRGVRTWSEDYSDWGRAPSFDHQRSRYPPPGGPPAPGRPKPYTSSSHRHPKMRETTDMSGTHERARTPKAGHNMEKQEQTVTSRDDRHPHEEGSQRREVEHKHHGPPTHVSYMQGRDPASPHSPHGSVRSHGSHAYHPPQNLIRGPPIPFPYQKRPHSEVLHGQPRHAQNDVSAMFSAPPSSSTHPAFIPPKRQRVSSQAAPGGRSYVTILARPSNDGSDQNSSYISNEFDNVLNSKPTFASDEGFPQIEYHTGELLNALSFSKNSWDNSSLQELTRVTNDSRQDPEVGRHISGPLPSFLTDPSWSRDEGYVPTSPPRKKYDHAGPQEMQDSRSPPYAHGSSSLPSDRHIPRSRPNQEHHRRVPHSPGHLGVPPPNYQDPHRQSFPYPGNMSQLRGAGHSESAFHYVRGAPSTQGRHPMNHPGRGPPPPRQYWQSQPRYAPFEQPSLAQHVDSKAVVGRSTFESSSSSGPVGEALPLSTNPNSPLCLLALPEDKMSLSETLCTVRENIEIFTATKQDVEAPAPGRKRPVSVGQVGLRCIHCRSNTNPGERVKRAMCFPSSMKTIYRTVIDMKLDHFQFCPFVPPKLKFRLDELKAVNTRSTGTTMQYFVKAAEQLGLIDGPTGIHYKSSTGVSHEEKRIVHGVQPNRMIGDMRSFSMDDASLDSLHRLTESFVRDHINPVEDFQRCLPAMPTSMGPSSMGPSIIHSEGVVSFEGKVLLSLPEDLTSLSPLRRFLRQNVYAFSAKVDDIAIRTPTTFSVALGQVGIGCIHCHSLPARERSNRAVCFPFSIARIYQSVADIQRFHLGECKMVPADLRQKFIELQNASTKGSKGLATRQYWVTSAKKLGLVDTSHGIRFSRDPASPLDMPVSLDILAQVASDVNTASKSLVLPEDEPTIAQFLYIVMEQLQACRFTEADRNKRRLKNVGCIGVECKHCAGQVDSRKFFWSSVNAVESNFVSVHTHMMECKMVPQEMKDNLGRLKLLRKEQTSRLKTGSQKAFFARVWNRLHSDNGKQPKAPPDISPPARKKSAKPKGIKIEQGKANVLPSLNESKAEEKESKSTDSVQTSSHVVNVKKMMNKMNVKVVDP